jgi:hypothetical protein
VVNRLLPTAAAPCSVPGYVRCVVGKVTVGQVFSEYFCFLRRDSAVGIVTGYGLDDGGVGVRVPVG